MTVIVVIVVVIIVKTIVIIVRTNNTSNNSITIVIIVITIVITLVIIVVTVIMVRGGRGSIFYREISQLLAFRLLHACELRTKFRLGGIGDEKGFLGDPLSGILQI